MLSSTPGEAVLTRINAAARARVVHDGYAAKQEAAVEHMTKKYEAELAAKA